MDNEFLQLENEAQQIDAELNAANQPPPQEKPPSLNAGFKPIIINSMSSVVGFGDKLIPFTSQYYNQSTIENIADSIINVADVEQLDLKKLLGDPDSRIGAWVNLAFTVGMPSFMFYLAVLEYNKAHSKPKEKEVKPATDDAEQPARNGFSA